MGTSFLCASKSIVSGQNLGSHQLLGQNLYEIQQVLWVIVTDVIHTVRRQRKSIFSVHLLRCVLHNMLDTGHDVIYISEVTLAIAVVEDFDGLTLEQLVREAKICHVGTTGGTINREEAQAGRGDVVKFGVSVCHQLIGLLGSSVKAYRVVHLIFRVVGYLLVGTVDRGRRCVYQMFYGMIGIHGCTAGLQNVIEANDVRFDVHIGIGDRITYSCLCCKVDDHIEIIGIEQIIDGRTICNITLYKDLLGIRVIGCQLVDFGKAIFLDGHVVVIVDVIKTNNGHRVYGFQKFHHQIGADESGGTGDEDGFIGKIYVGS